MIITPGYNFTEDEAVTAAKLNQLGSPTAEFEQEDKDVMVGEVQAQLPTGTAGVNYFLNPGLDLWTAGTSPVSCAVGVRQLRSDNWWARCNATTANLPTYERVANSAQSWLYAAKLTGATGVGSMDFGQDIAPYIAAALTPKVTVTFTIANGTGLAFTPQVRLDTCNSPSDYATVTNRAAVNTTQPVASGATTSFSVTLDLSAGAAASALRNGALIYVRVASGSLDSAIKNVTFSAFKVEIGEVATTRVVERDLADPDAETVADRAYLDNGDFDPRLWMVTTITCTEDIDNYAARSWWANSSDGNTMIYQRDGFSPNSLTTHCAKLTGSAATTGTVDFGTNIDGAIARYLARSATFSAYVYNGTGAPMAPNFRVDTCNTENVFTPGLTSNQENQVLTSCPNGAWTRVSFAFNGSNYANLANGARMMIRFPAASLNNGAKFVRIAQAKLELGSNVTEFLPAARFETGARPIDFASDLLIYGLTTSTIQVLGSWAVLADESGRRLNTEPINLVINAATTGANGIDTGTVAANTPYFVWLIGNRAGSVAALISLSATAPTLPAGYTFKLRIGWTRYTSSDFRLTLQRGRSVRYVPRQLYTNVTPASGNVYTSVQTLKGASAGYLGDYAPNFCCRIFGNWGITGGNTRGSALAATSTGIGEVIRIHRGLITGGRDITSTNTEDCFALDMFPGSPEQDFFFKSGTSVGANNEMDLIGFDF